MSTTGLSMAPNTSLDALHVGFLSLLPTIEKRARLFFRHYKCPHKRADAVAETAAICWIWYVRLAQRGKDASLFPATLTRLASLSVQAGRRLCGQERSKDAMSPRAQHRQRFVVQAFPEFNKLFDNAWEEALHDNTRSPVPDAAAFRCDFPAWLRQWSDRDRRILNDMAMSERTSTLSNRFGISPARISQLRRRYHADWCRFHGEEVAAEEASGRGESIPSGMCE